MRRQMTARRALEELAEALGRETYRTGFGLSVDLEPVGQVGHERVRKIAYLTYRMGHFENAGHVSAIINRNGKVAGWRLTPKGRQTSQRRES